MKRWVGEGEGWKGEGLGLGGLRFGDEKKMEAGQEESQLAWLCLGDNMLSMGLFFWINTPGQVHAPHCSLVATCDTVATPGALVRNPLGLGEGRQLC